MITHTEIRDLIGADLLDSEGDKVGKIGQIYVDDTTGEAEWATVNTGPSGPESFVPLAQADRAGRAVRVPYQQATIKDAPKIQPGGGRIDESQERELYAHYGLDQAGQRSDSGVPSGQAQVTPQHMATAQPAAPGSDRSDKIPTRLRRWEDAQPGELVGLSKETVQAVDRVSEQVRKERVATAGEVDLTENQRTRNR